MNNVDSNTGSIQQQQQQPSYILWYNIDDVTIQFCVSLLN